MANSATISIQATMLPDEIAKTFSGSMIVAPDDDNDSGIIRRPLSRQLRLT